MCTHVRNRPGGDPIADLPLLTEWLRQAGRIALSLRYCVETDHKADGTTITAADREIEAFLFERISNCHPDHQIIGEESPFRRGEHEFIWAVDPIDGTRAFASGLPIWGISVGVLRRGEPYLGAFYMPAVGEMYWGNGQGAFCNGRPLHPPARPELNNPLAFLAVPSNAHHLYDIDYPRVRSLGSTAAHLVYVARNAAIGALTRRVNIWDVAGVLPVLMQTQSDLIYLSGRPFQAGDLLDGSQAAEPLVAAHRSLLERVLALIHIKRK